MTEDFTIHQGKSSCYAELSVLYNIHTHMWKGTGKMALDIYLEVNMTFWCKEDKKWYTGQFIKLAP